MDSDFRGDDEFLSFKLQLLSLTGVARIDALLEWAEKTRPINALQALGFSTEAQQLVDTLETEDALRRAHSVLSVALAHYRLCAYSQARDSCTDALQQLRVIADVDNEARALLLLGSIESEQGFYQLAIALFQEAMALCDQHRLEDRRVVVFSNLGLAYEHLGDYATALQHYLHGTEISERYGSSEHRILIRVNMGNTLQRLGRPEEALSQYQEAQVMARAAGNIWGEGLAWNNQGSVLHVLGLYDEAITALHTGLPLLRTAGYRKGEAEAHDLLGEVHQALGMFGAALDHYAKAVALALDIGAKEEEVQARLHLGVLRLQQGDLKGALESLQACLMLAEGMGRLREARDAHHWLVKLHEKSGTYECALAHHKEYYRLDQQLLNETQNHRIQSLLIQHDVEAQRQLNTQLKRSNEELELLYRQKQELFERVQHQMMHDTLTGLPNRALFDLSLRDALVRAEANGSALAVMFIDLNGFKKVNDTFGHAVGDELLVQVAARFTAVIHAGEMVARLSGDEFVAFVDFVDGPQDAPRAGQRLLAALDKAFELRGQEMCVGASIGVSLYPDDGLDAATLQQCADEAMYRVKRSAQSGVQMYGAK